MYTKAELRALLPKTVLRKSVKVKANVLSTLECCYKFMSVCNQIGIRLILLEATCICVVRDNNLLSNDSDFDVGILAEDIQLFSKYKYLFEEQCFYIGYVNRNIMYLGNGSSDIVIDVSWIYPEDSVYRFLGYKWRIRNALYKEDLFRNLLSIKYNGFKLYVPNPPELYLKIVYGKDWRIPNEDCHAEYRAFLSRFLNWPFVSFNMPLKFSGDERCGTYRPWASWILRTFFSKLKLSNMFKHPN